MESATFVRLLGVSLIAAFLSSCGGGGGGDSTPAVAASKIFVGSVTDGDPSHAPIPTAIGSSPNSNPSPGPVVVERIITGPSTMLDPAFFDFSLDVANDRLYVADLRSILVFDNASTATGNVAPSRTAISIPGGLGGFNGGVHVDTTSNRLYAGTNLLGSTQDIWVVDNASAASGLTAPSRFIRFTTDFIFDIVLDATRDVLYVYNNDSGGFYRISVFDAASTLDSAISGTITPNRTINLNGSGITGPVSMFVDSANDRLYAPTLGSVLVFDGAHLASGSLGSTISATRTINLPVPDHSAIFVELTANRLYAADARGLNIIANASTVDGTPPTTIRVLAPSGMFFKAVVVKP